MGIARAIRRVKRQAKQGGLNAVMSELGEGLRSRAVPAPLRGAARRIASLIDPTRASKRRTSTPHAAERPDIDPGIARPPAEVTTTGLDSGVEPNDEPPEGTPVDAARVGATPTYNATPVEVAPIDATPAEVTPIEVTPVEVSLREPVEAEVVDAQPPAPKPPAHKPKGKSSGKKPASAKSAQPSPDAKKEKLAAADEPATSVPRSGSKTPKKRPGTRADTTSKKK